MRNSVKNMIKLGIVFSPFIFIALITGAWIVPLVVFLFVQILTYIIMW